MYWCYAFPHTHLCDHHTLYDNLWMNIEVSKRLISKKTFVKVGIYLNDNDVSWEVWNQSSAEEWQHCIIFFFRYFLSFEIWQYVIVTHISWILLLFSSWWKKKDKEAALWIQLMWTKLTWTLMKRAGGMQTYYNYIGALYPLTLPFYWKFSYKATALWQVMRKSQREKNVRH